MRALVRPLILSSLLAGSFFSAPAARAPSAADRATARELGTEGKGALDKKDYATAEDRFRRADALFHAPTLLLGYARAEAGLGKVVNASEAYSRIVREGAAAGAPAAFVNAVEAAKNEVGAVQARIASVTITVAGPDNPSVTLDDQPVPVAALGVKRPVDPGDHTVKATADGWDAAQTKFTVTEAGAATASLAMTKSAGPSVAAAPQATPSNAAGSTSPATAADTGSSGGSTQRTLGLVGMGVGGAGLVLGVVTGVVAIGQHSSLATTCATGCPESAQGSIDSYHTMALLSTVGLIAGGVLAAGGAVLFFTAPSGRGAVPTTGLAVTPYIGLGSAGAVGTF